LPYDTCLQRPYSSTDRRDTAAIANGDDDEYDVVRRRAADAEVEANFGVVVPGAPHVHAMPQPINGNIAVLSGTFVLPAAEGMGKGQREGGHGGKVWRIRREKAVGGGTYMMLAASSTCPVHTSHGIVEIERETRKPIAA
jgi:hypothetical protein